MRRTPAEMLATVCTDHMLGFLPTANPKTAELERAVALEPESPPAWRHLANLYWMEGNPYRTAVCWKARMLIAR